MSNLHPDSVFIDRIGSDLVMEHFLMKTRQNLWLWRSKGVPPKLRNALRLLGESRGVDMSNFETSSASEMSSAQPS